MSFSDDPSKEEVMRWSAQTLAGYMRRLNLSSCDNVVMKNSITGAQFMHMTQSQLKVFPNLHLPILATIQRQINIGEQKIFDLKSTQNTHKTVFIQDEEVWNSDEFSSDDDQDYEYFKKKTEQKSYNCPVFKLQTTEKKSSEKTGEENYRIPAESPRSLRVQDCHRANSSETPHPQSTRREQSTKIPSKSPGESTVYYSDVKKDHDRSKRPGQTGTHLNSKSSTCPPEDSTAMALGSSVSRFLQQRAPLPTKMSYRSYPFPPVPSKPANFNKAIPEPKKCLDPSWYGGNVARHEAEAALRAVNKDGAFMVRDSSKGSAEHPHTLMLLNKDKVYNIRIRRHGNSYLLGTKSFPGVTELIIHHMNTPLVLIDATDQSSAEKPKCCLLHASCRTLSSSRAQHGC